MNKGNKIDIKDIKSHEITLAKCGALSLIGIVDPTNDTIPIIYELRSNERLICGSWKLSSAIKKYNELVQ